MTLYIDDSLMTAMVRIPLTEGWVETDVPFEVRKGLKAEDISPADVALIAGPESPFLGQTHFIDPEVAVVAEAVSPIAMRTPVRPDGVEETPIRMLDTGPTAEVLIRALLRPYFGITAASFVRDDDDPAAADAQVVIVDGVLALTEPEYGFQEDLAKAWYILTSASVVHHVTVVGVEAEARGVGAEIDLLKRAVEAGVERRRDVRRVIAEGQELDHDRLVELTNRMRFQLESGDRQSLRNLLARGIWGTRFQRALPAFRDELQVDEA
jgi:predicted solute-binding protein